MVDDKDVIQSSYLKLKQVFVCIWHKADCFLLQLHLFFFFRVSMLSLL